MGLDMYLSKKTYVKNWDYMDPKERHQITVLKNGIPVETIDVSKVNYIEEEIAYWRKANQIHNWFVENVQEGKDDCGDYYVEQEQLRELVNLCKKIIDVAKLEDGEIHMSTTYEAGKVTENYEKGKIITNVEEIEELLPTSSGFFFGSTQYDEYYLGQLQDTIDMLEPYLSEKYDDFSISFYYSSSW